MCAIGFAQCSQHLQAVDIRIRRTHIYEDALSELSPANVADLRAQVRVHMTNWAGATEAGIDGGGVFREFLSEVVREAFSPHRALFTAAAHSGELYVNPLATFLYPEDEWRRHFYFLGRLLGKAVYEQQLIEMHFASFFMAKLQRPSTTVVDVHHLQSLDPVLAESIRKLKRDTDDVAQMFLDFSVLVDNFGAQEVR